MCASAASGVEVAGSVLAGGGGRNGVNAAVSRATDRVPATWAAAASTARPGTALAGAEGRPRRVHFTEAHPLGSNPPIAGASPGAHASS